MKSIFLNTELELNTDYDVIVIGGGPSGCAAAIASARDGCKTLLIENTGALGGMGTNGLVPAWCPFSDGEKIIYRGIAQKIFEETKARMKYLDKTKLNWVPIDPEALKLVYDTNVIESGAEVLFNTTLCHAVANKNKVSHIIVSNKLGLTAYQAKVYIDCTGDADLVYYAGGEFDKNDALQAPTLCFMLSNVNQELFETEGRTNTYFECTPIMKIVEDKNYPLIDDAHACNEHIGPNTFGFNAGHIFGIDSTNPFEMSKAYIEGRRKAAEYKKALAEYVPSVYGDCFVSQTAPLMGVRESRRIRGDYTLTLQDYIERKDFDDEIGRNCYYIDVHSSAKGQELNLPKPYGAGESHGIPYRCLVPKDFDNILVAGRSISTERLVQGSIRVMPVCLVTGEAAGCAAAEIVSSNCNTHTVNVQNIRKKLKEYGAYFK